MFYDRNFSHTNGFTLYQEPQKRQYDNPDVDSFNLPLQGGKGTLSAQASPGGCKLVSGHGSPQVEEETGYCLMPKCAVSGNHTQPVNSDTPSPIPGPHCPLFLGACLKSLRPGRLLGAFGERGWALPGPPPTPKLPEAIPGLRVSRSGWEGHRERQSVPRGPALRPMVACGSALPLGQPLLRREGAGEAPGEEGKVRAT